MPKTKDEIGEIASKMLDAGLAAKRERFTDIKKSVEAYNGIVRPALRGRFSVPVPVLGGFVDTLQSKIDESVRITFSKREAADYRKALKMQAAWDAESSSTVGKWSQKDLAAKKFAIFTGRGIMQYFAASKPEYESTLEVISPWDFFCEPKGGGELDTHYFRGKINVFRDKEYIYEMAQKGVYNTGQVAKLLGQARGDPDRQEISEEAKAKEELMRMLNLVPEQPLDYLGTEMYNLAELEARIAGKRYYILMDTKSRMWVRIQPIKEVHGHEEWSYRSWATHYDADNFWSKAPCDDMLPTAEGIQLGINQLFDAMNKHNWPQRLVDYKRLVDPAQLDWTPFGIIEINRNPGEPIDNYVKTFQDARDSQLPTVQINLIEFLKSFVSRETGITPSAQGLGDEKQATILVANLRQVSDRLGLYNKNYQQMHAELGYLYQLGLREHMPSDMLVQIIGENGVEEEYLQSDDVNTKFDIGISGGNAEEQQNELKLARKEKALDRITADPELRQAVNKKWRLREILTVGGYEDAVIHIATDSESEGNEDLIARAAQAIQDIIRGKKPKQYARANRVFLSYIYNFASSRDLKPELYRSIIAYADAHVKQTAENEIIRAQRDAAVMMRNQMAQGMAQGQGGPVATPAATPPSASAKELSTPLLPSRV